MRRAEEASTQEGINVVVAPLGGERKELFMPTDSKVEEVLEAAGYPGLTATVNGERAEADDIVEDGDRLILSGNSEGKVQGGRTN